MFIYYCRDSWSGLSNIHLEIVNCNKKKYPSCECITTCNKRKEFNAVFPMLRRGDHGGASVTTRCLCVPVTVMHGSAAVPMTIPAPTTGQPTLSGRPLGTAQARLTSVLESPLVSLSRECFGTPRPSVRRWVLRFRNTTFYTMQILESILLPF